MAKEYQRITVKNELKIESRRRKQRYEKQNTKQQEITKPKGWCSLRAANERTLDPHNFGRQSNVGSYPY